MARLGGYRVWIALIVALLVIGVLVVGVVGCESTSTGTGAALA